MLDAKMILNAEIANSLISVGIPTNTQGFQYLKDSISLVLTSPEYRFNLTKQLYPEIAKRHNSSSFVVERSIRRAIEVSFLNKGLFGINEMLNTTYYIGKDKPCNGYFIGLIAEIVRSNFIKNAATQKSVANKKLADEVLQILL